MGEQLTGFIMAKDSFSASDILDSTDKFVGDHFPDSLSLRAFPPDGAIFPELIIILTFVRCRNAGEQSASARY